MEEKRIRVHIAKRNLDGSLDICDPNEEFEYQMLPSSQLLRDKFGIEDSFIILFNQNKFEQAVSKFFPNIGEGVNYFFSYSGKNKINGIYSHTLKEIHIYIDQILSEHITDKNDISTQALAKIKNNFTNTMAHEFMHAHNHANHKVWVDAEKFWMMTLFGQILPAAFIAWIVSTLGLMINNFYLMNDMPWLVRILLLLAVVLMVKSLIDLINFQVKFRKLDFDYSIERTLWYSFCYDERSCRKKGGELEKNPEWSDAFQIIKKVDHEELDDVYCYVDDAEIQHSALHGS